MQSSPPRAQYSLPATDRWINLGSGSGTEIDVSVVVYALLTVAVFALLGWAQKLLERL
jgi:hypothetical protein